MIERIQSVQCLHFGQVVHQIVITLKHTMILKDQVSVENEIKRQVEFILQKDQEEAT